MLLDIEHKTISQILGNPDNFKLHSSMTLFDMVSALTLEAKGSKPKKPKGQVMKPKGQVMKTNFH